MGDPRFVESVELAPAALIRDPAEAHIVLGLLESAGIPSILQPASEIEGASRRMGPEMTFGGPQKVMVHAHRLEEAQALIASTPAVGEDEEFS